MVLSINYHNSECCEIINKKYYENDTIIYEYEEAGTWAAGVGNCIISKTFYKKGLKHRRDVYLFAGEHCDANDYSCPKIRCYEAEN